MSKFISGTEAIERFKLGPFELIGYMQQGLPAVTADGRPVFIGSPPPKGPGRQLDPGRAVDKAMVATGHFRLDPALADRQVLDLLYDRAELAARVTVPPEQERAFAESFAEAVIPSLDRRLEVLRRCAPGTPSEVDLIMGEVEGLEASKAALLASLERAALLGQPAIPATPSPSGSSAEVKPEKYLQTLRGKGVDGRARLARELKARFGKKITVHEIGRLLRKEGEFNSFDANKKRGYRLLSEVK